MKLLLPLLLLFATCLPAQAFDHSAFNRILGTYVNSKGMVNYAGLKKNRSSLDAYLTKTGSVKKATFDSWGESERLAFLINIYNAETLQYMIDNYPLESIKDLGGWFSNPWDKKNVTLFGEMKTLNQLEHKIIRKDFDEPRIHFALVCAAVGCPPLRNEAFTASALDAQLDDQTRTFLAQSTKNRVEGDTLHLSPIFKWYKGDFTKNGKTVQEYVAPYIKGDPVGKDIEHTDYDWSLNEQ